MALRESYILCKITIYIYWAGCGTTYLHTLCFYYSFSVSPQQMEVLQRSFDSTQSILHKFIEHLSILPPPRDTIYY